jgi:hypothetical protein
MTRKAGRCNKRAGSHPRQDQPKHEHETLPNHVQTARPLTTARYVGSPAYRQANPLRKPTF